MCWKGLAAWLARARPFQTSPPAFALVPGSFLAKSRILYEQMLGRATRLCPEIDKETFRIFDAVGIYDALQPLTAMKPVVVNPKLTITQLFEEFARVADQTLRAQLRDDIYWLNCDRSSKS